MLCFDEQAANVAGVLEYVQRQDRGGQRDGATEARVKEGNKVFLVCPILRIVVCGVVRFFIFPSDWGGYGRFYILRRVRFVESG